MVPWQHSAAWFLLVISALGAVLPPPIIFLLKPKVVVRSEWHTKSQLPLDTFFLLDASSSVKPPDWARTLTFVQDMVVRLNASSPHFRAGAAQFSDQYKVESELTGDITGFSKKLQGAQQLNGTTFMAAALCGARKIPHWDSCSGGALAELLSAPKLPRNTSCGVHEPKKVIMMVTDGIPTNGEPALESSFHLKNDSNATLMGVLVGGKEGHARTLYAMTSCCNAEDMHLEDGQPACKSGENWTCPHMVRSTNYSDLVLSSQRLAEALTADMDCTSVEEKWNTHPDLRSLWFLLLPLPMLAHLLIVEVLACLQPPASTTSVPLPLDEQDDGEVELEDPPLQVPAGSSKDAKDNLLENSDQSTLKMKVGSAPAPAPEATKGKAKKFAPVRCSYIISGKPTDVNYGSAAPPAAPNAARRGDEKESIRDTAEVWFANNKSLKKSKHQTLTLVATLADTAEIGDEEMVKHPMCRFLILLPMLITLVLIPLVVLMSGALDLSFRS